MLEIRIQARKSKYMMRDMLNGNIKCLCAWFRTNQGVSLLATLSLGHTNVDSEVWNMMSTRIHELTNHHRSVVGGLV